MLLGGLREGETHSCCLWNTISEPCAACHCIDAAFWDRCLGTRGVGLVLLEHTLKRVDNLRCEATIDCRASLPSLCSFIQSKPLICRAVHLKALFSALILLSALNPSVSNRVPAAAAEMFAVFLGAADLRLNRRCQCSGSCSSLALFSLMTMMCWRLSLTRRL